MKHFLIILLGLGLMLSGCRKDDILQNANDPVIPSPGYYITANVNGVVTDFSGNPIANTTVSLEGETATTDQLGFFKFKELLVDKKGGVLTFSKSGYFDNYKVVYPQAGKTNNMKVIMPSKSLSGSFQTSNGGLVTTNGGASVSFPVNGIMTSDGQPYDGDVNVYAHWYDPTDIAISRSMPGNLRGIDEQGNEVQLATYGMMAVELESPAGIDLNLSEGSMAKLEFPLTGIEDDAPAEVPLWSFDEESATWVEEGVATKNGSIYSAQVSHFSFWNCDAPFPLVEVLGVIKDTEGNLVPFAAMCFEIVGGNPNSWFTTAYGYTNEYGEFFGKMPKDKEIRMTIKDECGNVAYEEVIGPFSENTNMGIIEVQLTGAIMVSGSVADCDGNLISEGYVVISYPFDWNPEFMNSTIVEVNEDGTFEFVTLYCGPSEVTVQAYDFNSASYSDEVTVTVASGQPLDLGVISMCNDFEEYIIYNSNGTGNVLLDVIDLCILDGNAVFTASSQAGNEILNATFTVNNIAEGSNSADSYQFVTLDFQTVACVENCEDLTFIVTTLGTSTGDFVEGTFSGQVSVDASGDLTPFEGSFKVKIDYLGAGSSVSGVVWDDVNADGIRDASEPLVEGEYVYLFGEVQNVSLNTSTDANGAYSFENLKPGTYYVGLETNYQFTTPNVGSDDSVDSDFTPNGAEVTIDEDVDVVGLDCGLLISNTNEPLVCNVGYEGCAFQGGEIFASASGGVAPYTFEMSNGENSGDGYFYVIDQGTYIIIVTDANGTQCETIVDVFFEDVWGQASVWFDENKDGLWNDLDSFAMVDGVLVELFDSNGNLVDQKTTSNGNSWLNFTFPYPSEYYYQATTPSGYILVTPTEGPNGQLSSGIYPDDMDPSTGQSNFFAVEDCWNEYSITIGIQEE